MIEFKLDGTVISANENFLRIFGYGLDEIVGKHHRIFCDPAYAKSPQYAEFWQKLGRGEYHAAEFKRLAKGGREIYYSFPPPTISWVSKTARNVSSIRCWL